MKVVLVANTLMKYREEVYYGFIDKFSEYNIDFYIIVSELDKKTSSELLGVNYIYLGKKYIKLFSKLNEIQPDVIINFLHLSNPSLWLLYLYTKIKKIPNIYWNHGINLQDPNNKIKNFFFSIIHKLSTAIILYSKNEVKCLKSQYHVKTFIANNAINFSFIPRIPESKETLKSMYNLKGKKIVLFVGRIQERKRLDVLLDIFSSNDNFKNHHLVIVGPGMFDFYKERINMLHNVSYFGSIYDELKINQIFKMSDLFCIPGTNGLGLNQAMYWSLPCLALDVKHSPEIIYLKNGVNGFIESSQNKLADKMLNLLNDEELYDNFSKHAHSIIREEANLDKMFLGFIQAINYSTKKFFQ